MQIHRALTAEQVRKIASVELSGIRATMARDVFMLSFVLIGMNTADLYNTRAGSLKDGVLTYNRSKTDSYRSDKALMKVRVEKEAVGLIEKYKGDAMQFSFSDRYSDIKAFNKAVNLGLKEVGEAVGVEGLTSGHARHSWATMACNDCGIAYDKVNEALNHAKQGADRVTDIYVERDWGLVWEANRKVLDLVFKNS